MYFPDLTAYAYETGRPVSRVRTVGWLDSQHAFPTGSVAPEIVDMLRRLRLSQKVRQMRGFHVCEVCGVEWIRRDDPLVILGSAEIWIPDGAANYFAAPDLIIHYIEDHNYLPPSAFLAAVASVDGATFDRDLEAEANAVVDEAETS